MHDRQRYTWSEDKAHRYKVQPDQRTSQESSMTMRYLSTAEMISDILTKALAPKPFLYLRPKILGRLEDTLPILRARIRGTQHNECQLVCFKGGVVVTFQENTTVAYIRSCRVVFVTVAVAVVICFLQNFTSTKRSQFNLT